MYNKTIIGFGFCDMQNYQRLGKSYLITLTSTLIISHITKTSSNNCLLIARKLLIIKTHQQILNGQNVAELINYLIKGTVQLMAPHVEIVVN